MDNLVLFEIVKNYKSWKTVLVTKLGLRQKKPKTAHKKKIGQQKERRPRFLECAEPHVLISKKNEGKPHFECIRAEYFRWN